jgi:hypothetical protein
MSKRKVGLMRENKKSRSERTAVSREEWKPGNMLYPVPAVMVSCNRPEEVPNIITIAWTFARIPQCCRFLCGKSDILMILSGTRENL